MDYKKQIIKLLETAITMGASDLHISSGYPPILRITKELIEIDGENVLAPQDSEGLAMALMTDQQQSRFKTEKQVDFAYQINGSSRFRVNVFIQRGMISVAFRVIASKIKTIEELGLPAVLNTFVTAQQGFVLITGPTSHGKSTTMASIVDQINHQRAEHIITIEDPIEYIFVKDKSLINQREVGKDTISFSQALKASLREDPDVIMVGEMRDLETISTAVTAAETGHLVLSTLHTNSAGQTIHRLIDVFSAHQQNQIRSQLASSLLGVVSQRLVPKIDGGFAVACEIMFNNSAVANLIRENKIHEIPSVIETSGNSGMSTLNKSLADLVVTKEVSAETALRFSLNPLDLQSRIKRLT